MGSEGSADEYSLDFRRRPYGGYHARKDNHVSYMPDEGGRPIRLDSFPEGQFCSHVSKGAQERRSKIGATSTPTKSFRTGQKRTREARSFPCRPRVPEFECGTTFLGLYERQSGSGRQRDNAFELCIGTESIAPLASNLSDRSCHALAEADGQPITDLAGGECPEPDSATVSWLARAVPRPCNGRCRPHGAADCLLPSRTRSPAISITGGRRHIVPVRIGSTGCGNDRAAQEIGERERECSAVGRWTQRISDSVWYGVTCRSVNR